MWSSRTQRLEAHPMVDVRTSSEICGLVGDEALVAVRTRRADGTLVELESRALFCFVGADPDTDWLTGLAMDDNGFLLTDSHLSKRHRCSRLPFQTSASRVFAAGDVRSGSTKRVASAVGEGASAVASVHAVLSADDHPSTNS
jgi:thioredoxin reductase (NADPH)